MTSISALIIENCDLSLWLSLSMHINISSFGSKVDINKKFLAQMFECLSCIFPNQTTRISPLTVDKLVNDCVFSKTTSTSSFLHYTLFRSSERIVKKAETMAFSSQKAQHPITNHYKSSKSSQGHNTFIPKSKPLQLAKNCRSSFIT